jgi:hypothetical protein
MQINGIKANDSTIHNYAMNNGGANQDEQIKFIQKQIENVKKQLQNISDNKDMPPKDMMKKRQELQQKIQDLNKQIEQRKIEIQNEKREEAVAQATDEIPSDTEDSMENSMSTKTMEGLIGANNNMHLANTPMKVYKEAKNRKDNAKMERAMGYVGEFTQKAKDSAGAAAVGMKEDARTGKLKREESLETREEDKVALENKGNHNVDTLELKTNVREKPVIYTKTGEKISLNQR